MRKASILGTSVSITTSFNPLIFVDNIITIEDEFYNFKRERFLVQSISYSIGQSNQMTLSVSNVQNANAIDDDTKRYLADNSHNFITTAYGEYLLINGR